MHSLRFSAFVLFVSFSLEVVIDTEGLPDTGLNTTSWVSGQAPPLDDVFNLHDMQLAAKNTISKAAYGYYRTGALDEITYHANLDIWKTIKLKSRAFRSVANISTETTILSRRFSQPSFITSAGFSDPANGEVNFVRAAAKAGTLYASSIASNRTTAEIGAQQEIEEAGFKAIFLTVDNPTKEGVQTRFQRAGSPDSSNMHAQDFDLTALAALQNQTSLTVVLKGISNWRDAALLHTLGFPACYISNHGGRLVDGQQTAAEILLDLRKNTPEVLDNGKMGIYADGGVRHGSDVLKLLALGARAVGLGRSPMFANIWGEAGVDKLIDILATELSTEMKLIGVTSLAEINSTVINTKIIENWLQ